jgi:branched-chain amino acid transport system ATP-binding protein
MKSVRAKRSRELTLEENSALLQVDGIHTFIGKSHILHGVSIEIEQGTITALLGRNGVGKSTTLKSIIGLTSPQQGSVRFRGQEIAGMRAYKICRLGIGYVPEERRIFPNLTVRQNLLMGVLPNQHLQDPWTIDRVYGYFPQLGLRDRQKGGRLSGGEQQMLTIGRTLMGNPELILVDEPTEGLSPLMVDAVVQILRDVNEIGCTVLVVEHALDVALDLASRAYVMSKGEIVFRGTQEDVYATEEVRKKYLEV